jgi:hypothetical protein
MKRKQWIAVVAIGLGLAFLVALASPLASSQPDGLEKVADEKGFLDEGKGPSYEIIPDYTFPGVDNENVATILSGIVGVVIVAAVGFGVMLGIRAARGSREPESASPPSRT